MRLNSRVVERLKTCDLRKLGNIRKGSIEPSPQSSFQKKTFVMAVKNFREVVIEVFCSCPILLDFFTVFHKQPPRGVLSENFSENMQQIYRSTPMPKCDSNEVALQLYWNHFLPWVFSSKFAVYFQNTFFLRTPLGGCFCR